MAEVPCRGIWLCSWEKDIFINDAPCHAKVFMHKTQLSNGSQCVELLQTLIAKISHKVKAINSVLMMISAVCASSLVVGGK